MSTETTPQELLGRDYHICFSVGGVRGAFHAGAVHAIVLSGAPRPGLVAGSSIGSAHAAMLARLLDEGEERERAAALRDYLNGVLNTPNFLLLGAPDLRDVFPYEEQDQRKVPDGDKRRQGLKRFTASLLGMRLSTRDIGGLARAHIDRSEGRPFGRVRFGVWLARAALNGLAGLRPRVALAHVAAFLKAWRAGASPTDRMAYTALQPYGLHQGLLPFDRARELIQQLVRRPGDTDEQTDGRSLEELGRGVELLVCAADLHLARLVVLPPDQVRAVEALSASMALPLAWTPVKRSDMALGAAPDLTHGPFVDAVRVTLFPFRQLLYRLKHLAAWCAREQSDDAVLRRNHRIIMVGAFPAQAGPTPDIAYDNMVDVVERSVTLQAYSEVTLDIKLAEVVSDFVKEEGSQETWRRHTDKVMGRLPAALGAGWNPKGPRDPVEDLALRLDIERVEPQHATAFRDLTHARPEELGALAAEGCRRTLSTLVRMGLLQPPGDRQSGSVPCEALLSLQAGRRFAEAGRGSPGFPEVCAHCTRLVPLDPPLPEPETRVDDDAMHLWAKAQKSEEPVIAMTLAGGVFKGVFQLGTVHALHILGRKPKLLAGASVGTLVAAQAARVFTAPRLEAQGLLQLTAFMYYTQDRWVPTRRWRSLQRDLLLRLSETKLRLADLNRLFRDYRKPRSPMRAGFRTAQGLQQLLFVWPAELLRLWDAAYDEKPGDFWGQTRAQILRGLRGYGVPLEVLGAENIQARGWELGLGWRGFTCYRHVLERGGIALVATATDLTAGRIRLFGLEEELTNPALLPAVFASSAFPGLFRPRRDSEVFPEQGHPHRLYSDGGIFNNNPLNEVTRFLRKAAQNGAPWLREPPRPHLLLAASLDPEVQPESPRLRTVSSIWSRTQTLSYNHKLDRFKQVQGQLADLVEGHEGGRDTQPIPVRVEAIYPRWVVKTFGATKAMGFDAKAQLESIAHGCRRTLERFSGEGMEAYGVRVQHRVPGSPADRQTCPWFERDGKPLQCAFAVPGARPEGCGEARWAKVGEMGQRLRGLCADPSTHEPRE